MIVSELHMKESRNNPFHRDVHVMRELWPRKAVLLLGPQKERQKAMKVMEKRLEALQSAVEQLTAAQKTSTNQGIVRTIANRNGVEETAFRC
jgi:hypothetical protein